MARKDQLVSFLCFFLIVSAVAGGLATVLPMRVGKQYVVGGRSGWRTPPPSSVDLYAKWAAGIRFYVADSIGKAPKLAIKQFEHRRICS